MKGTYEIEFELNELKVLLLKEMLADYIMDHAYSSQTAIIDTFHDMIEKYENPEVKNENN